MEFRQLEAFVSVVKKKGFSKAAEAINLTQPTISTHINALEKELGVKLIDRKGKDSRPTKHGRIFYNYALNMINTRERALNAMKELEKDISGVIEIKTSTVPGQFMVPELMTEFIKVYPDVTFKVDQTDSGVVWHEILDNMGEIGFVGEKGGKDLECELLRKDKGIIITPKNDKFLKIMKRGKMLRAEDIRGERFIRREESSATRYTFEEILKKKCKMGELNTVAVMSDSGAIKESVSKGLGISVLTELSAGSPHKPLGDYLCFEIEGVELERCFYMIYNNNITLSPAALKFKDFVLKYYK